MVLDVVQTVTQAFLLVLHLMVLAVVEVLIVMELLILLEVATKA
jgi:hypothetical protein